MKRLVGENDLFVEIRFHLHFEQRFSVHEHIFAQDYFEFKIPDLQRLALLLYQLTHWYHNVINSTL